MTPKQAQALIDRKVAPCVGQNPHVWKPMDVFCPTCGRHDGFECVACRRVADWERDTPLYEAIERLQDWRDKTDGD